MKTLNELWLSAQVYEQMTMMRQTEWVKTRLLGLLNRTERELVKELVGTLATHNGSIWRKLDEIQKRLDAVRSGAWASVGEQLGADSVVTADRDIRALDRSLRDLAPTQISSQLPSEHFLRSVVASRPFQGRLLKDWASKLQSDELARMRNAVQTGLLSGRNAQQIVASLVGTQRLQGRDGTLQISRNQLTTVVETAIQHIMGNARQKYAEDNADLFDGERFTAVLDVKTTAVCRSLDGNVYPIGVGPMTPLHFGCRSMRVPVLSQKALQRMPLKRSVGLELLHEFTSQKGYTARVRSDLSMAQRREFDAWLPGRVNDMIGKSVERQTYAQWLDAQPVSIQEEALGKAKAALYRKGGLSLDKFVARDGKEFTLAELVKRHREAFIEAGINPDRFEG